MALLCFTPFEGEARVLGLDPSREGFAIRDRVGYIAPLPRGMGGLDGDAAGAALALVILSAIWLGLAMWRIRRFELGSADG